VTSFGMVTLRWSGSGAVSSSIIDQTRSNPFWAMNPASIPAAIPIGEKRNFIPAGYP
jgi:hypothetical protein